ncbi:DUF4239 domain-containing protein [Streptomyces calidiresistens]|uniref:DUF4239 domain-containing protein n=1 Tax=Streptomyces calidiresistens TaxID=1485586 RepID=A0A7W3T7G4_9ACTN|nr:DUF4239 domain-containing protein [Streptomyces calidiresistens]MBB0232126.1 DUF4239 domain-containing protein [Streptomyces calidiresistens]
MSPWLVLSLAVVATCGLVLSVGWWRGRRYGAEGEEEVGTPAVIDYMIMMIGVVYAIVLGLAIAGVWEERSAAEDWVRQEAQALHEVGVRAEALPAAVRDRVREDVDAYVRHTLEVEWPHMVEEEELTERGDILLERLREGIRDHRPEDPVALQERAAMTDHLAAVSEARTARAQSAESTMPAVVWVGLLVGGLVVVGLIFVFRVRRSAREVVLSALFSALIGFLLYLIWHFDSPFARGLTDSTEAFELLFPHLAGSD